MYLSIPLGTPQPLADTYLGGRLTVLSSHQIVWSIPPLRHLPLAALTSTLPFIVECYRCHSILLS